MILGIDKKNNKIKLFSLMRDMYLDLPDGSGKQNLNYTMAYGGPELILKTINTNFNLKVDKIKAPLKIGDIVGSAEIIDNDGNIVDEVDVTIDKEIKKANILDYMLKNLRTIGAGKSLLKQN